MAAYLIIACHTVRIYLYIFQHFLCLFGSKQLSYLLLHLLVSDLSQDPLINVVTVQLEDGVWIIWLFDPAPPSPFSIICPISSTAYFFL